MGKPNRYVPGFRLLNELVKKRKYDIGSGVAVAFGDALILTSGYIALATSLQQTTPVFIGIANAENTAAEASADAAFTVEVIPPDFNYDFMVPVEATDLITVAQRGYLYDLESEDGIDEGDAVTAGRGFFIDEVDVSSAAIASATYGYAIGHFENIFAS